MNKQLPTGWSITLLTLLSYFFLGLLLTGEAYTSAGVPVLVLIVWFLIYKLRHKSIGNIELVTMMYGDLKGAVERLIERAAEAESLKRAAASRRKQVLTERENKRADRPIEGDTADKKYAEIIERRVREAKAKQDQGESTS
ncbi:MAG TPA: hypothetical protein VEY13_13615 [Rubrobacteraceae bacterium]|jgi:hypothetical protein|nr:hypothetical protein [Rubrobacteraceae bacterium]